MWRWLKARWDDMPTAVRVGAYVMLCALTGATLGAFFGRDGVGALMGLSFAAGSIAWEFLFT